MGQPDEFPTASYEELWGAATTADLFFETSDFSNGVLVIIQTILDIRGDHLVARDLAITWGTNTTVEDVKHDLTVRYIYPIWGEALNFLMDAAAAAVLFYPPPDDFDADRTTIKTMPSQLEKRPSCQVRLTSRPAGTWNQPEVRRRGGGGGVPLAGPARCRRRGVLPCDGG